MTDYEKVMQFLREQAEEVRAKWDGDSTGREEDEADKATHLLELLDEVDALVKELDL